MDNMTKTVEIKNLNLTTSVRPYAHSDYEIAAYIPYTVIKVWSPNGTYQKYASIGTTHVEAFRAARAEMRRAE